MIHLYNSLQNILINEYMYVGNTLISICIVARLIFNLTFDKMLITFNTL